MGKVLFTAFEEIASKNRLSEWFAYQTNEQKPLCYLLPSVKWFQAARKLEPGISFQTFDDLAMLLLKTAKVEFTSISEEERVLLFYEIIHTTELHLSEKDLAQKAQAYADSYGQLKRLGLKVEETPEPLKELREAFCRYEKEYRDQQGLFDLENRIFKAVETTIQDFPLSHVIVDGYMDFSPVQYLFIEHLVKAAVPCTIYLPPLDTPIIHETVSALHNLGIQIPEGKLPSLEVICQKSTVTGATTSEEEIHGVLESIARLTGTDSYNQFGIVLANEQRYLDVLERISEQRQIPLKWAKKKRLAETNFLSFLNQVLDKQERESKWDQIPLVDTVAKLCFLSPIEFNKVKDSFIRTGELGREEIALMIEGTKRFQAELPEEETVSTYINHFLRFLENSPLPALWRKIIKERIPSKLSKTALEMRAFQRVMEIVKDSMEKQPVLEITVHLETFRNKLLQKLSDETLYVDRKPMDGVEIYSFRDVPLFKGTHLFVLGLNEGEFPKQTNLSGYFQERYVEGISRPFPLPISDYFRKKDDAAFAQLKYLVENVSFSFVEGMNPNQPLLPSKYLMEMTNQSTNYSTISRLASDTYLTRDEYEEKLAYHVGIGNELMDNPPLLNKYRNNLEHLQSGNEQVSNKWEYKLSTNRTNITRLESYATCSFKFGLERLLDVQEPLEKQRIIDPIETGIMLHRIIETFYQEAKGKPFNSLSSFFQGKDEEKLADIFEKEWAIIEQKYLEIPRNTLLKEKEEWWKKLRRWLAAERISFWENEQLADMTIFKMEESVEFTMELENKEVLTLTGKIDRIDIDEQGFVIYDYKSSRKDLDFENEVPAGLMLQIPLYMIALEHEFKQGRYQTHTNKEAIGGGYISIKEPHHRKKNTVWKNDEHKKRFQLNNRIQTHILAIDSESLQREFKIPQLIERLWRGTFTDFSVRPFSADSCKYCSYKAICRVTKEQQDS